MNYIKWQKKEIAALESMFQDSIANYAVALVSFEEIEDGDDTTVVGNLSFSRGARERMVSIDASGKMIGYSKDFPALIVAQMSNALVHSYACFITDMFDHEGE
jgi:hypothetical protein